MPRDKRKSQAPIVKFWENKLNLNYNAEIEYYRKLCGLKYNNEILCGNIQYNTDSIYLSYQEWNNHILNSTIYLDLDGLKDYSRFLNQRIRDNDITFTLYQSVLMPYIICILSIAASMFNSNQASDMVAAILFIVFIVFMFERIFTKDEDITKNFYHDVKEIIDEKIYHLEKEERL